MLFTTFEYGLLLAVTFAFYWSVPASAVPFVLLIASIVFYSSWSVPYLALVGLSIVVGYAGALAVASARSASYPRSRFALLLSVAFLLGILAYFKYANFVMETVAGLVGRTHEAIPIVLPLGISFYTFQIIGYVVDVHRGAPAERSLLRFPTFVGFFPQLIAGPICRGHELLPQLVRRRPPSAARLLTGLQLIAYGVVKKTVFADNLAVLVDRVYGSPDVAGGLDVVLATIAFGGQIYCDFSGYTDIGRGSAKLFGIELPVNFRSPYGATSITDFWRRWHITLSSWLRDYLYIPLGGNRKGTARTLANLLITMGLGGLWHGASFTFAIWGLFHGVSLVAERALGIGRGSLASRSVLARAGGLVVTFVVVQMGWAIFRAEDLGTLGALSTALISRPLEVEAKLGSVAHAPLIGLAYALHALTAFLRSRTWPRAVLVNVPVAAVVCSVLFGLTLVFGGSGAAFIYFQF